MNLDKIEKIYNIYGFESREKKEDYIVFLFSHGYFRNVEIVHSQHFNIENIEKKYQQLKYPVNVVKFESLEKINADLFNGFFLVSELSHRLQKQYKQFVAERNLFGDDYKYIPCSYYMDNKEGTENIIEFLFSKIERDKSSLTILEAAAGYGKTCSVYELMNKLSEKNDRNFVPLFIELSKNRNARIFKYVLLDEIDRNFSSLSSDLVISEIRSGRVPLIIDGFDELLSSFEDNNQLNDDLIDNSQTMLDTIVELLEGDSNAKIIITSRKTSLISGKVLDGLILKLDSCPISRITLKEPKIESWLEPDKIDFLKNQKIPLGQFSNPILLKWLQKTDFSEFAEDNFSIHEILDTNLNTLFNREKERQQLPLKEEEQNDIFESFAGFLIELQISSEEPLFIFEIFKDILGDKIQEFITRYTDIKSRPNENEFIAKLTRHALLDTNKAMDKQIGFINDFIFGLYLAKVVIHNRFENKQPQICKDHIDKICTTYKIMPQQNKDELFDKLLPYIKDFDCANLLQIDAQIKGTITRSYFEVQLDGITFNDFNFSSSFEIRNCIFSNCVFINCLFGDNMIECQFMDCCFYDISYCFELGSEKFIYGCSNFFFNCIGINVDYSKEYNKIKKEEDVDIMERRILEQFWCPGRNNCDKRRQPKTLFRGFSQSEYKSVANSIDTLKKKKILLQTSYCLEINIAKIAEIREILGR